MEYLSVFYCNLHTNMTQVFHLAQLKISLPHQDLLFWNSQIAVSQWKQKSHFPQNKNIEASLSGLMFEFIIAA